MYKQQWKETGAHVLQNSLLHMHKHVLVYVCVQHTCMPTQPYPWQLACKTGAFYLPSLPYSACLSFTG